MNDRRIIADDTNNNKNNVARNVNLSHSEGEKTPPPPPAATCSKKMIGKTNNG